MPRPSISPGEKIVRLNLTIPASLQQRIEDHARTQHRSTSAQIRLAIAEHLSREDVAA